MLAQHYIGNLLCREDAMGDKGAQPRYAAVQIVACLVIAARINTIEPCDQIIAVAEKVIEFRR